MNSSLIDLLIHLKESVYSNSLIGLISIVDPELKFNSPMNKEFLRYCKEGSSEFHFDDIESQLSLVRIQEEIPFSEGNICFFFF